MNTALLSASSVRSTGGILGKDAIQKKREGGVALLEDAGAAELAELFGEVEFVVMLEDDERVWSEKIGGREKFEGAGVVGGGGVRRVDEDVVDLRAGRFLAGSQHFEATESVDAEDGGAARDFERVEIVANQFCGGRVVFDEGYVGGAAAEGFDAYGAGTGEDVDEARPYDSGAEDVEERFAQAVAGGTESESFQAFEDAAAIFAGDDTHWRRT